MAEFNKEIIIRARLEMEKFDKIQKELLTLQSKGSLSDGYHTYNELYEHRMILFSIICNQNKNISWKSKLHEDGTMYENYFIAGIKTPEGQYTYHYHMDHWDKFEVLELEKAPKWDGHKPSDITRLYSILKKDNKMIEIIEEEYIKLKRIETIFKREIERIVKELEKNEKK